MIDTEILSVYELMDVLQIGKNAAYHLLNTGKLKAFRVGRTWKIPRGMVDEFIISSSNENLKY